MTEADHRPEDAVDAEQGGAVLGPYPGLRPFREDETLVFFGREDHRRALLRRMASTSFVAIIGTSGSGKSSIVNAGLIPDLYSGYLPGAGSEWMVVGMEPGTDPIGRLAGAFAQQEWALSASDLRTNSRAIVEASDARLAPGQQLLVLVDQCEELFRLTTRDNKIADHDEKASFIRLLLETGAQTVESSRGGGQTNRLHVVMAMRSEFLGRASQFHGLPEAIDQGQYLIPRLSREQLRRAIEAPVGVARGAIEEALVQRVLNDLGDDQDQLPVLQHALQRTWNSSTGNRMTVAAYEAIGSMSSALSAELSEALVEAERDLGTDGRRIVKRLFQSLRETDPIGQQVRRPTTVQDLCEIADCTVAQLTGALAPFRSRSFVRPYQGPLAESTLIDVSHEALLRRWTLLTEWIANDEADARSYLRIARRAAEETGSSKPQYFTKPVLPELKNFWERRRPSPVWAMRCHPGDLVAFENSRRFLEDSVRNEERLDREQRGRDQQAARRPILIGGGVLLLSLAAAIVGLAFYNRSLQQRALETLVIRAGTVTTSALSGDDRLEARLQLAAELYGRAPSVGRPLLLQSMTAAAKPLASIASPAASVALSSSGDTVFGATKEGRLRDWNRTTGAIIFDVPLPSSAVPVRDRRDPVVLTAGTKLVVVADGVTIWDAMDGRLLNTPMIGDPIAWSTSGSTAAFVEQSGAVAVCELADDCARIQRHNLPSTVVQDLGVSEDSSVLALVVTSEPQHLPEIRLFALEPWGEIARRSILRRKPLAMVLDAGGLRVCWSDDVSVFSTDLSRELPLSITPAAVRCAFSPSQTATADSAGTVRVWEILNDQLTLVATASTTRASMNLALATPILAVSGESIRTWDVLPFGLKRRFTAAARFQARGKYVLSSNRLYDSETGQAAESPTLSRDRARLWGLNDTASYAVFYAASNMVVAELPSQGPPIEKWPLSTREPREILPRADGRFAVMKAATGDSISILDDRGMALRVLNEVSSYAFVPGTDDLLALHRDNTSAIWPMRSGAKRDISVSDSTWTDARLLVAAFSPDGTRLAVAQSGYPRPDDAPVSTRRVSEVIVWHWPDLRLETRLPQTADVRSLAFRADSNALLTVAFDKTVRVWDLKTGGELASVPVSGRVTQGAFTRSGQAALLGDAGLTVVPLDPARWLEEACARISRNLTPDEWRRLFSEQIKYRKTCPTRP